MKPSAVWARSELDGLLACAILRDAGQINEVEFVNPLDLLTGSIRPSAGSCLINVPGLSAEGSRWDRNCWRPEDAPAGSTASGLLLDSLEAPETKAKFTPWVEKLEGWHLRSEAFLEPAESDPVRLLAVVSDPVTGLGRFRDFIVSNYFFLLDLIDQIRSQTPEQLVKLGDVQDRLELLAHSRQAHDLQIRRNLKGSGALQVVDLLEETRLEPGHPFARHLVDPDHEAILTLFWDKNRKKVSCTLSGRPGRRGPQHLGQLMIPFGGGGDSQCGIAQIEPARVLEIVDVLKSAF